MCNDGVLTQFAAFASEDAVDFHPYAKAAPPGFDGRNGSDGEGGSNSMSPTDEASKERRRAGG